MHGSLRRLYDSGTIVYKGAVSSFVPSAQMIINLSEPHWVAQVRAPEAILDIEETVAVANHSLRASGPTDLQASIAMLALSFHTPIVTKFLTPRYRKLVQ